MAQIVLDGNPLLLIRIPLFGAYIARRQVVTTFVLATSMLECILRRVAQLTDRGLHVFTKLDVELQGPHAVFVRIHELSPVGPRIRPHLLSAKVKFPTAAAAMPPRVGVWVSHPTARPVPVEGLYSGSTF